MSIATYEDVRDVQPNTLLIDVREPKELAETGKLPHSINIPLGQLENAFQSLSPEEFESKYGRAKPSSDDEIIFSCKAGGRALRACTTIAGIGYNNLKYYKGSWTEWAEKAQIE